MRRREFAFGAALAAMGGATKVFAAVTPPPSGERLLQLQPLAPARAGETHSALAISNQAFGGAYRFTGTMRTVRQLREHKPNAWEVAWLFWNFGDDNHLYYFLLKPNGWEIGKRDPRYAVPGVNDGQKIMATGETLKATLGQWYAFDIRVNGNEADICVDGKLLTRFKDADANPLVAGRVGLYCEDSLAQWHGITAPLADGFAMEPVQVFADGSQLANWTIAFLGYGSGGIVAA